ncbi:amidohydrolase family protein [Halopiger goleimassiliensis]|uniref:amidohydrolase family protein n=1 Tax=Halopiger goleimassiliensis TaxID=1293048 RepID=UPI000677DF2D|nr:amidohydrolase family protein [Halopiger goleimassiliensis]
MSQEPTEPAPSSIDGSSTTTRRRTLATLAATSGIALPAETTVAATDDARDAATEPDASTRDDAVADLPLFDAHTHVVPAETLGRDPLSADELVEWLDAVGIDRAVVHALDSPEAYPVQAPSWWVLEELEGHDRLVPFCTVDPRVDVYGADTVLERLESLVERGARGIGELKAGVAIDDERLERLYELCAEYDLPALVHVDDKAMLDAVGLPRFEDVLASYPGVDFLAHAHGWWAHVSADVSESDLGRYPERPVEPGGRVPELLAGYDNCYGDLAGMSGWNALTRDPEFGQAFLEDHHEHLVFGTDYLYPGHEIPHLELFDRFDLEREAWSAIRYRNLESLLG